MAASVFARIGTIKGESHDARHRDEIDVLSWSWGITHPDATPHAAAGGGAGKAHVQNLSFTHHLDKASPLLMAACATGKHIPDARITARKAGEGQVEYLVITLSDVLVTSVATSGAAEGDSPFESITLAFAKVDLEYLPQKPDGSLDAAVHFTFDLQAGKVG